MELPFTWEAGQEPSDGQGDPHAQSSRATWGFLALVGPLDQGTLGQPWESGLGDKALVLTFGSATLIPLDL